MSDKPKDYTYKTDGIEFTASDVERIIESKKRRLDDLAECWDSFTRHMECGEIRRLKESCIDDEIEICILSEWLHGFLEAVTNDYEIILEEGGFDV